MIHKVNRPSYLTLVTQPKKSENDPGGSSGGGNAYEQMPSGRQESAEKDHPQTEEINASEQIGLTSVVTDFMERNKQEASRNPGLTTRYTSDSQPAKGLLLNKKIE